MSAPTQLHIDRSTRGGRALLRATSSIENRGRGPVELRGRRLGRHRWAVYQNVYDAGGGAHLIRTRATLVFKFIPGDRYGSGYVGDARYWKLKHAAAFELWSVDEHFAAVQLVRTGPKVDYCLRDLRRFTRSGGSPGARSYPACSEDPGIRRDILGTSVGWADVYPYGYPEQWIDVTGLRGRFALVQRVDPDKLLIDDNHANDVSETYVKLPSGRVLGHRVAASAP